MPAPALPYRERLYVPWTWWALAAVGCAAVWAAFYVATPPAVWAPLVVVVTLLLAGLLLRYGAVRLGVDDTGLRAGRAFLPRQHVGAVTALGPEETRRLAGVASDARAYLLLRPYCSSAVRVDVSDADDPTPYWLLSTRRPERLAESLSALCMQD